MTSRYAFFAYFSNFPIGWEFLNVTVSTHYPDVSVTDLFLIMVMLVVIYLENGCVSIQTKFGKYSLAMSVKDTVKWWVTYPHVNRSEIFMDLPRPTCYSHPGYIITLTGMSVPSAYQFSVISNFLAFLCSVLTLWPVPALRKNKELNVITYNLKLLF